MAASVITYEPMVELASAEVDLPLRGEVWVLGQRYVLPQGTYLAIALVTRTTRLWVRVVGL